MANSAVAEKAAGETGGVERAAVETVEESVVAVAAAAREVAWTAGECSYS